MFYVPWDWHVDSQRPQDWLIPVMEITSPWRLTLLFLVSGAATRLLYGAYQRQGAGAEERLAGSRLLRLGLPLLFGMAVIVPPQTYFEVVQHVRNNGLAVDIYNNALTADFWQRYLTASGQWCDENGCIITPTWEPPVVCDLCPVLRVAGVSDRRGTEVPNGGNHPRLRTGVFQPRPADRARDRSGRIATVAGTAVSSDPQLRHGPLCACRKLSAYVFGFMLVGAPKVTRAFVRYRHLTAAAAVLSALVWCSYAWVTRDVPASEPVRMAMRVVYAVDQWAFIATIMGYAARHIHSTTPLMKYLGGGIFTFYIVHQTLIVVAAANVEKLKLPLFAEMGIVLFITVGGSVLAYEIAKRIGVLGLLLGVSAPKRAVSQSVQTPVIPV